MKASRHRWPSTEKEWFRFRDRWNPVIAKIARGQGVEDPDFISDIQGRVWYVLLVEGMMKEYRAARGPIAGFLVALVRTICFFEADHERRRQKRFIGGPPDEGEDHRQAQDLKAAEFQMLYEQADAAVKLRRVNATAGPKLLRRVWAGLKNDESRRDMANETGYSEQYIALMVAELRRIPEVGVLRRAT